MRGRATALLIGAFALGVVLGFALGGIGPRRELAARDREVAALEGELARAEPSGTWRSPVPGLDRILRAPRDEESESRGGDPATDDGRATEAAAERPAGDPDAPDGGADGWRDRWRERSATRDPDDAIETFDRVARIQEVRRIQSRAALVEQAGLDAEEERALDEELARMNEELVGHGEELLLLALDEEPPAARDLLGITHDVTGILHRAQLRIEQIVGRERASSVDPTALEIWNHVDLRQLEPAARAAAGHRR